MTPSLLKSIHKGVIFGIITGLFFQNFKKRPKSVSIFPTATSFDNRFPKAWNHFVDFFSLYGALISIIELEYYMP